MVIRLQGLLIGVVQLLFCAERPMDRLPGSGNLKQIRPAAAAESLVFAQNPLFS